MTDPINLLTIIGAVTSQVALITAVFYYFGWVYTHAFLGYFGIDPVVAGYTTADYVLRSINVAFLPFIYAASAALALFGLHRIAINPALTGTTRGPLSLNSATGNGLIVPHTAHSTPRRATRSPRRWTPRPSCIPRLIGILQVAAIAIMASAFAVVLHPEVLASFLPQPLVLPLSLIISVALLGYAAHLRSRHSDVIAAMSYRFTSPSRTYILSLLVLGLVAASWALGLYGDYLGTSRAKEVANKLSTESRIVLYCTERIALRGPGVKVAEIAQPGTKYHYQYTGLRMLAHSTDRFILLPSGWQHGRDRTFLLRDDDSLRIDIEVQ
jgi:hypothetical protein